MRATITGWGSYTPPAVITNTDLESLMDTNDEWITSRTGIKERRITHLETSEMATIAGSRAMAAAGVTPEEIDLLIVATCTPDRLIPSAAALVQPRLGLHRTASMDINAACSGFVYGLSIANGMLATGVATKVLLIGVDKLSTLLDLEDRSTAVLFGDGAGAVVLEAARGDDGVLAIDLGTDGSLASALTVGGYATETFAENPEDSFHLHMDGAEVFRNAVTEMGRSAAKVVADAGLELEDVDLLIPHQANTRIIDATARRMKLPAEKVFVNIAGYGNTSAASIPIALAEAIESGRVQPGSIVVFVAFGGGLTWGGACLRFGDRTEPVGESDIDVPGTTRTGVELLLSRQEELRRRRGLA